MTASNTPPGDPAWHALVVATPAVWPAWPFLPVTRLARGRAESGVLFDARGSAGVTGYGATVFRCPLAALPPTFARFLALPKEAFDSAEELVRAGWRVA